jgi:hypothetical protein
MGKAPFDNTGFQLDFAGGCRFWQIILLRRPATDFARRAGGTAMLRSF